MYDIAPMLAKAVPDVPAPDAVAGGLLYEPKWDGFRAIVYVDGEGGVEIGSRGSKMLTRYFPELVQEFRDQLAVRCILDGEIVVRTGRHGHERLDWEMLSQRIHPAESRVRMLAETVPASFIAFDLLAHDGRDLMGETFSVRRAQLEDVASVLRPPLHLTQTTGDVDVARRWLVDFEGAGLDGVVAKPLTARYAPGKRVMLKAKHHRTADVVLLGYRVHASGEGVGSLLLGLYDSSGVLRNVGGCSAFTMARRRELVDELAPLVVRDASGEAVRGETDRSRFASAKDVSFVTLEPTRVLEVAYDQMEGHRFRHTVQFVRWRPDRDPRSCTFEQLERPVDYDLSDVLA